jgi:DNA polymerase III delta prime subunit
MSRDPIVEQSRPKRLDDIVDQDAAVSHLREFSKDPDTTPHLILSGPPGCGKTSAILAWAREVYGNDYTTHSVGNSRPVRILNMSAFRSVKDVLSRIHETCKYIHDSSGSKCSKGLIVCDEADSLTAESQEIMVYCIRKYEPRWIFVFVMNQPSKIGKRLWGLCKHIPFLPLIDIVPMITKVIKDAKLGRKITKKGIQSLINIYEGDLRKILNAIQGIRFTGSKFIPEWKVWNNKKIRNYTSSGVYKYLKDKCHKEGSFEENKLYLELGLAIHRPGSLRPLVYLLEECD